MATTEEIIARGLEPLEETPSGRSAGAEGDRSDYPWVPKKLWTPPRAVREAAWFGLELRKLNEARGLARPGGTAIGVARAVQLSSGKPITPRAARRIRSYLARAKPAVRQEWLHEPSPALVAWLLWGGDDAVDWIGKLWKEMNRWTTT